MLKNAGREKIQNVIRCPKCKERLNIDNLKENGYLERLAGVTIITCPYCDEQWQEK